ncbi:hypothetical protein QBC38DRAFT_473138 [Podospora fimiseda]|uniref:Uncharacterized protein n=1 Tax=Podospora fimiseda TaxID=252190 RepID=A0AAN7H2I8_9PEZI|nr:hypothetical protein QBC38DRAFT_473138 [Podospora fimiseda]
MSPTFQYSIPRASAQATAGPKPSLLSLPLELRLEIYKALLWNCPLPPAPDLAPGYPTPRPRTCVHSPLDGSSPAVLMPAYRPLGCIPTSFLLSCRQIYHESRAIPFQQNEFVFQEFFTSGLVPADVLVRRLEPWQREELRWVRIEVPGGSWGLGDNLAKWWTYGSEGSGSGTWKTLCERLKGVRGLRVRVNLKGSKKTIGGISESGENERSNEVEQADWGWVDDGMKRMKELRWLEIEVANGGGEDEKKIEYCRNVESKLNKGKLVGERKVRVVAVSGA